LPARLPARGTHPPSRAPHFPPQVGAFETQPAKIAAILKRWLGPLKEEFRAMAQRSKALGRPEAVYKISRDLAAMIERPQLQVQPLAA
jgi:1,2-diacylglycerol 3-beta-galactosyltransferase